MMGPLLGSQLRCKFDPNTMALTVSGNSISDPSTPPTTDPNPNSTSDLWAQVMALPPVGGKISPHMCAHNGQSIQQLATLSDVDNAYENGKTNYLFFWELTNNIWNDGRTGTQTIADAIAYIKARQNYITNNRPGQKPWLVVLATGLPRGGLLGSHFTAQQGEAEMQYCNNYIRQHYRDMGAISYVEMRRSATGRPDQTTNPVAGFPFDFTDNTNAANFPSTVWDGYATHPTNGARGGKSITAQYIVDVLRRLPAR